MAASSFRLATLLKIREADRDQRRRHLAEALEAEQKLEARAEEIERELSLLEKKYAADSAPGNVAVDRLIEAQRYEFVVRGEQQLCRQQMALVAEETERRRQALIEADRQVRVLEKLHDRLDEKQRVAAARRETKELDELGLRGHGREQPS